MFLALWNVMAPVLIAITIGYCWGRSRVPYAAEFVTRAVMNIGAPCLVVSAISRSEISGSEFAEVAGAAVLVLAGSALLGWGAIRATGGDIRALLPSVTFPNNGNMGLPLCLFAFGQEGLALAVGFFIVQMTAMMVFGIPLLDRQSGNIWSILKGFAFQPLILAVIIGLVLLVGNIALPQWLDRSVELLAGFTIPLMLITLGVSLSTLSTSGWWRSLGYSTLRIGGGLVMAWWVVECLDITGTARGVVLLQAIMPAAVFNYLLALKYDQEPTAVAGIVVVSTVMALVAVPVLLAVLL
ncbi:MAG: AEC family transporter [Porticoccus sp.]|jgi:predicted permease|uniref:AEC family transporter n=1 Tax=Porticoccus sp. TaxID=2024853 RepID=UPI003296D41C|tara:strand:+ start:484120 stop:485010 length:891 start_codon:yes stop_codon:yes gene_type:complete